MTDDGVLFQPLETDEDVGKRKANVEQNDVSPDSLTDDEENNNRSNQNSDGRSDDERCFIDDMDEEFDYEHR